MKKKEMKKEIETLNERIEELDEIRLLSKALIRLHEENIEDKDATIADIRKTLAAYDFEIDPSRFKLWKRGERPDKKEVKSCETDSE